jgi:glycosyltransferase involved in cell wall biosynthesis
MLASIIVNNYNYGRFLSHAIDSALSQTYPLTEVIVVDDGSTDDSRDILRSYGEQIKIVLKKNGGQASTFNAGFLACSGEVIFFLDADDALESRAVDTVMSQYAGPKTSKIHWPLWQMDSNGVRSGARIPQSPLPSGDLSAAVMNDGPWNYVISPTSGNAWSRHFLQQVLPMPEDEFRICADAYLFALAPLCGNIQSVAEPLGCYRRHGQNNYHALSFAKRIDRDIDIYHRQCSAIVRFQAKRGIEVDPKRWEASAWPLRIRRAMTDLENAIPPGETFILADGDAFGTDQEFVENRWSLPFLEREGQSYGPPSDDDAAIRELTRMRSAGASYFALAWPAFWFAECYPGFFNYLQTRCRCVLKNDRLILFHLGMP